MRPATEPVTHGRTVLFSKARNDQQLTLGLLSTPFGDRRMECIFDAKCRPAAASEGRPMSRFHRTTRWQMGAWKPCLVIGPQWTWAPDSWCFGLERATRPGAERREPVHVARCPVDLRSVPHGTGTLITRSFVQYGYIPPALAREVTIWAGSPVWT